MQQDFQKTLAEQEFYCKPRCFPCPQLLCPISQPAFGEIFFQQADEHSQQLQPAFDGGVRNDLSAKAQTCSKHPGRNGLRQLTQFILL